LLACQGVCWSKNKGSQTTWDSMASNTKLNIPEPGIFSVATISARQPLSWERLLEGRRAMDELQT
jgi:hypothetical protein